MSGAQQLMDRVSELESTNLQLSEQVTLLQRDLQEASASLHDARGTAEDARARAAAAEEAAEQLRGQLGVSTPRPRRDMGLLSDLLPGEELVLVEQALIAGDY